MQLLLTEVITFHTLHFLLTMSHGIQTLVKPEFIENHKNTYYLPAPFIKKTNTTPEQGVYIHHARISFTM